MGFQYKGVGIFYTDSGKGPAVVFLHGFLENSKMWKPFIGEIAKKNRVICVDLLGHGKSGNLGYIHSMEDQANMIKALLSYLRLRKYVLIGHSMGGYVSLAFAKAYQKNVKGICLQNSTSYPDSINKKVNRQRAIEAVKVNHKRFVRLSIPNLFSEQTRALFKNEIDMLIQDALQLSTQGIIASLEGMKIRKDRTKVLKNMKNRILIIGKNDPILNHCTLEKQALKTKTKKVIFADGHMSHIENRNALLVVLKEFIKSCN